jgi:ATP-dependent DNA ligase
VPQGKLYNRPGYDLSDRFPMIVEALVEHDGGEVIFRHACKLGLEGIVSKRKDSPYRSGRSPDWLKMKSPDALAVKRESEEDWGK